MAEIMVSEHLDEVMLRRRLGIPEDARQVLILAESSHWDPNWLYTSEEYYTRWVESNMLQMVDELERSPERVYSVECMFFLRLFWERHPEKQQKIREYANAGRLRITSSGVTSADTLTPDPEAILRDLLLGQQWLRDHGIQVEPRLAYFPDCFGHTPALPALLNAAGFTMTAFSRLDGMYMVGCDYESKSAFPRPGSSAEILQAQERCLDFIWRGSDASQVLAHWNAFTYGQGDMIAYHGIARVYLFPRFLYRENRSESMVANRIHSYIAQLEPLSRTPYLFCPIGLDFVAPIPDLVSLLKRYNQIRYPNTGIWVLNAGLDDYLELVNCYCHRLPVLDLDPNPYWTGFYTSRPSLKKRSHLLLNKLLKIEGNAVRAKIEGPDPALTGGVANPDLSEAWWSAATANHHDFITGTSPDRVVDRDQVPMLERALSVVDSVQAQAPPMEAPDSNPPDPKVLPAWERQGEKIIVNTPYYGLEFDEKKGGCIARAWNPTSNTPLLSGLSNELVSIRESGGLWRMGMEFKGGKYRPVERSGEQAVHLDVQESPDGLLITASVRLGGQSFQCATLCRADSSVIRFRVTGRAPVGHTITARFDHGLVVEKLSMENPGGVVHRPLTRNYEPTFWPVQHFCHLPAMDGSSGMAILLALPGAIACHAQERSVEIITQRNATQEKAYGLIPILACPAKGHELEETICQYGIVFTGAGGWQGNRLPQLAREYAHGPWITLLDASLYRQIAKDVLLDSEDVWVEVLKPAWRGEGIIVRLYSYVLPDRPIRFGLHNTAIRQAWECDARERDLQSLEIHDGQVPLVLRRSITSLRILI